MTGKVNLPLDGQPDARAGLLLKRRKAVFRFRFLRVKWLIGAQIAQEGGGSVDSRTGDLDYDGVAPWATWGPYLWADGTTARTDGLTWVLGDLAADGTHPSTSGRARVAAELLDFFKTSPHTSCWFLASQVCP
jgi:hypothetical protein